jgi:hypothetical protein
VCLGEMSCGLIPEILLYPLIFDKKIKLFIRQLNTMKKPLNGDFKRMNG